MAGGWGDNILFPHPCLTCSNEHTLLYNKENTKQQSFKKWQSYMCLLQKNCKIYMWLVSKGKLLSRIRLFATPWTVAYQAPPSMGFSRQEYWPFPSPGDLPDSGIEPGSPALEADALTVTRNIKCTCHSLILM